MKELCQYRYKRGFVHPKHGDWIVSTIISRAYCLHARRGIFAQFAYAWIDDAHSGDILGPLAPSQVATVQPWNCKWMLPDEIVTGCFARLLYLSNKQCGIWAAETLPLKAET